MEERSHILRQAATSARERALLDGLDHPALLLHACSQPPTIVYANASAWRSSGGLAPDALLELLRRLGFDEHDRASLVAAVRDRRPGRWLESRSGANPLVARLHPLPRGTEDAPLAMLSWSQGRHEQVPHPWADAPERLAAVFEAALEPMLLADDQGRYLDANAAACATFGWSRERFRELRIADLMPPEQRPHFEQQWARFLELGHSEGRTELMAHATDRRTFDFRAVANVRPGAHLSVLRDVTDLARAATDLREREQQFRVLADQIPDPVFVLGIDGDDAGRILYLNRAAATDYGYRADELLGRSIVDTLDAAETAAEAPARLARIRAGETVTFEGWHRRKDGSLLPIEARACGLGWQGRPAVLAIDRDISMRERAAAELRANAERLQLALDAGQLGMFDWDMRTGQVTWSAFHYELFGLDPASTEPITYAHFRARIHPDDIAALEAAIRRAMQTHHRYHHDARVVRPDGTVRTFNAQGTILKDAHGRSTRMLGIVQDITERRAAEIRTCEQLQLTQQRQQLLEWLTGQSADHGELQPLVRALTERLVEVYDCARASFWRFDATEGTLVCESCFDRPSGTHSAGERLRADEAPGFFAALQRGLYVDVDDVRSDPRTAQLAADHLLPRGVSSRLDAVLRFGGRHHGTLCLEHVQRPHVWGRDEIDFACTVGGQLATQLETAARAAAEAHALERQRFLTALIDGSPIGVQIFAPDGTARRLNEAMRRVLGLAADTDFPGTYNLLEDPTALANGLATAFLRCRNGEATTLSAMEIDFEQPFWRRWSRRSGRSWLDQVLFPVFAPSGDLEAAVLFAWDVADRVTAERTRHQLEDQLRQAQKLEAVGMLAGGVAHDFNNILTAVLGFAEQIEQELPDAHPCQDLARQVQRAAQRGAQLTHQLLAFGRKQVVRTEVFDAAQLVEESVPMVRQLLGPEIRLEVTHEPGTWVRIDKVQFQQVLLNLVVNARDAMPTGGRLTIVVRPCPVDDGVRVLLSVRDTGCGMDERVRERLFEPFFTTKEPGKGSGLGLSTVYGIVTQAGGTVTVDSAPGAGATFDVRWPAATPSGTDAPQPETVTASPRRARVLLVEDDAANRELAARILRMHGHTLLLADSGEAALQIASEGGHIDLLVTDMVMPGISGRTVAERLLAERPGLRVLFVSGFLSDDELRRGADPRWALLQKPFTANELLGAVQARLQA
ncbi:MAG: PAS domain S-box protein [Planctomycetes bacterium]|nr:PAS domain S-box protein [Planctomycetota bacterium]